MVGEAGPVKIAILGAGGRLGAALAREWSVADEVLPFARADLDLAQPGEIERVLAPYEFDALVNCAALTNVDYCETHEAEAMRINAEAAGEIGALCARKGARCLHIGTDYVFDGELRRPYTEEDAPRAISIYGESKLRGETALLNASAGHLVVRVSWVFGPDRPSFIDGILKKALESDHAEAIGDKWSTPSYTLDLARMLHPFLREIKYGGSPARHKSRPVHLARLRRVRLAMRRPGRPPGQNHPGPSDPHRRHESLHRPTPGLHRPIDRHPRHPHRRPPTPMAGSRGRVREPFGLKHFRLKHFRLDLKQVSLRSRNATWDRQPSETDNRSLPVG